MCECEVDCNRFCGIGAVGDGNHAVCENRIDTREHVFENDPFITNTNEGPNIVERMATQMWIGDRIKCWENCNNGRKNNHNSKVGTSSDESVGAEAGVLVSEFPLNHIPTHEEECEEKGSVFECVEINLV
jgi:hypothetical protein